MVRTRRKSTKIIMGGIIPLYLSGLHLTKGCVVAWELLELPSYGEIEKTVALKVRDLAVPWG